MPPSMTTQEHSLRHVSCMHGRQSQDPIACICATEQCLLVARESGVVHRYALLGPLCSLWAVA